MHETVQVAVDSLLSWGFNSCYTLHNYVCIACIPQTKARAKQYIEKTFDPNLNRKFVYLPLDVPMYSFEIRSWNVRMIEYWKHLWIHPWGAKIFSHFSNALSIYHYLWFLFLPHRLSHRYFKLKGISVKYTCSCFWQHKISNFLHFSKIFIMFWVHLH